MRSSTKAWNYGDILDAALRGDKVLRFGVANLFDERPYPVDTHALSGEGLPWLPAISLVNTRQFGGNNPWHTHQGCVEFVCCRKGRLVYESEGKAYRLCPGSVFVSRPSEPHRQVSDTRGVSNYTVMVSCRKADWLASGFTADECAWIRKRLGALPRCYAGGPSVFANIRQLFHVLRTQTAAAPERRIRLHEVALRLLLSLLDAPQQPSGAGPSGRVEDVAQEMRDHPERAFPTDLLVERLGLSPSSAQNAFKTLTGFSPHAFLLKCRIERAGTLLLQGQTMEAVADALGFSSRQHLSLQFRKTMGCSFRAWMAKHKKR